MTTSTALAYQMMIEEKLLSAMINAEQRGHYHIAAGYALVHADFIDVQNIPPKPIGGKTNDEIYDQYQKYYFDLLSSIGSHAKEVLADVRKRYGNKEKPGIPKKRV
ncbi:hypothetical protein HOV56_gp10 [Nitrosopumilus spindle-shaped virus]|uniref:Uncharacterized protein n=1 Tax=Nitrosopumilus spindle-shaped virus TaxID=2508184 RepID=A0A514K2P9_9VIRU|nr:hypothetical protein HOV56_gp10 [Nitrosopumilus spindle-shaped virus]QDI73899.1 hypothetical protein [Nitrosopumilus spindle-shaped virus]